jgi:hypothetical protein
MARQDNYNDDWDRAEDTAEEFEVDEASEFARRQQGAKRESAKRQRAAQKFVRQEREAEFTQQNQHRDRRAIVKDIKRRYGELKRIAGELHIKQTLENLSGSVSQTCWGPDVVSDKTRPSMGLVLNYTNAPTGNSGQLRPSLFGAWLYASGNETVIVVGSKQPAEDDTQTEHAIPPRQADCILRVVYNPANHATLQEQITKTLMNENPLR